MSNNDKSKLAVTAQANAPGEPIATSKPEQSPSYPEAKAVVSQEHLSSIRRQLAEERENLRLIQERKAEFVLSTEMPLQLVKEERRLLDKIAELERQLAVQPAKGGAESTPERPPWIVIVLILIIVALVGLITAVVVKSLETKGATELKLMEISYTETAATRLTLAASPPLVVSGPTGTSTNTPTPTPSSTPTESPAPTSSSTPTESPTPTPSSTPTESPTPTPSTESPADIPTPTFTPIPALAPICPAEPPPILSVMEPAITFHQVKYSINDGPAERVENEGIIFVSVGNRIGLKDIQFESPVDGEGDKAQVEAYVRKGPCWMDIDYEDSRTGDGKEIKSGINVFKNDLIIGPDHVFSPTWTIQRGWERIVIALIHYSGTRYEVDDRFFINLVLQ